MFLPNNVGAIEPVGITNASATKVRKSKASTKANAIDSSVSRAVSWCEPEDTAVGGFAVVSLGRSPAKDVGLVLLMCSANNQLEESIAWVIATVTGKA